MPARKEDAHRALELLEEYQQKLTRPQDQQLKLALENVIKIFKSSLFQALLDIQEFYEVTLLNDTKSVLQKTQEAHLMSSKFQKQSPFGYHTAAPDQEALNHSTFGRADEKGPEAGGITGHRSAADDFISSTISPSQHSLHQPIGLPRFGSLGMGVNHSNKYASEEAGPHSGNKLPGSFDNLRSPAYQPGSAPSQSGTLNGNLNRNDKKGRSSSTLGSPTRSHQGPNDLDDYVQEDITLERGITGLGFSISGGNDNPHFADDPMDVNIYISKIIEGGAAQIDGRMRIGDIVLQINDDAVVDVEHQTAVDALKRTGNILNIRVKRPKPKVIRLNISKGNRGLGISIAGGVGNEHIVGDCGIFVTKIVEKGAAAADGRLRINDKILAVGETSLDNCVHDTAVSALKNTGDFVDLLVERSEPSRFFADASSTSGTPSIVSPVPASVQDNAYPSELSGSPHRHRPRSVNRIGAADSVDFMSAAPFASTDDGYETSSDIRTVVLTKGPNGLGFNIVGGEDGQGIFISFIVPGGSCDLNGQLRQGDRILDVNGCNLRHATHEEAADALKNAGQNVVIVAQYRPDEYRQFEEKIQELKEKMISASNASLRPSLKRSLHVRALFDYDPSRDSGLPSRGLAFCVGDILHVTNASDDEWWQAKRMDDGLEQRLGIIPSRLRVERKERARLKSVKFEGPNESAKSASTSTLDRLTGRKKDKDKPSPAAGGKKFGFFKGGKEHTSGDDTSESEKPEERILSYEPVVFERLKYVRPVIVMGPFKDRINDDLLAEFPERFASCVPHTSRPKRDNEVNGRDYHFAESRDQLERDIQNNLFIEAGQYSDNLYGTSIAAVKDVAEAGKHCVLDVSGAAVKRLHSNNMFPVVIYVKPKSVDSILEMNRRMTEDTAQKSMERCIKLEKEFGHLFTAVVTGDTPEEIYNRVKDVIYRESGEKAWVPSKEKL